MAGHSKWANIKRHKAKQDAKRGKLYTKIIREITVSAKTGSDPFSNPRLRAALDKAQSANMTKDVVERAIKRGSGNAAEDDLTEVRYEGYGPGGTAVLVDCLTNNRNRTVGEVRHAFSKCGGNLGTDGSVAYLFKKIGQISFAPGTSFERIMELALECGAEDAQMNDDQSIDVITLPEQLIVIKEKIVKAGLHPDQAEVIMRASVEVPIQDQETAEKIVNLIDMLEDLDDVQAVYSNADIAEDVLNKM
ncbi:MAG: hypothetical protein A3F12_03500 [Gammaproteobacteria bacterium RIFCSPHIGHO2_12_FULL_38_14]|nr:MAG: hypothetical protein A3F12_03500 [Gammaproteobacteria bacterium RIFCSPHIGHO2_12_FULL_38_14]